MNYDPEWKCSSIRLGSRVYAMLSKLAFYIQITPNPMDISSKCVYLQIDFEDKKIRWHIGF